MASAAQWTQGSRRTNSTASSIHGGGAGAAPSARSSAVGTAGATPVSSSHMESSVTRLLVATKQLLESLTDWSHGKIDETGVSDVYVRLGNDFNAASLAFTKEGIEMTDLNSVPDDLRTCLEAALSEDASPATLEQHLPRIRQIVVHLLQGLKAKQGRWRVIQLTRRQADEQARTSAVSTSSGGGRDNRSSDGSVNERQSDRYSATRAARTLSAAKSRDDLRRAAAAAGPAGGHLDGFRLSSTSSTRPPQGPPSRSGTLDTGFAMDPATGMPKGTNLPRGSSSGGNRPELARRRPGSGEEGGNISGRSSRSGGATTPTGGRSSRLAGDVPPVPYNEAAFSPSSSSSQLQPISPSATPYGGPMPPIPPIPPSPPREIFPPPASSAANNSLEALRKTDTLQRRASKRFSTYTYNRIAGSGASPHKRPGDNSALGVNLGAAAAGLGIGGTLAPGGMARSPSGISVRERDEDEARELSAAGRELLRGAKSARRPSITKQAVVDPPTPSEEKAPPNAEPNGIASETPDANREEEAQRRVRRQPSMIPEESEGSTDSHEPRDSAQPASTASVSPGVSLVPIPQVFTTPPSQPDLHIPPPTPPPEGPPVIFLQLGRDVKKAKLDGGPPTITSLRMLFMERFQYSPGTDDFPAIYLRDPQSGVQYELEDMSEVKDRVVLSLNIDALDQVKTHIDLGLAALTRELKEMKTSMAAMRRQSVSLHIPQPGSFGAEGISPSTVASPSMHQQAVITRARRASSRPPEPMNKSQLAAEAEQAKEAAPSTDTRPEGAPAHPASVDTKDPRVAETLKAHFEEVQSLRRELGIVRQIYSNFSGDTKDMLSTLRTQTEAVKTVAATKVASPRSFIDAGKSKLESRSQDLVTRVEALQDTVEDLKQDVTTRKIRPKQATMTSVNETMASVAAELEDLSKHITTIKPAWKRAWEDELQTIVDEQQLLNYQEDLLKDLREDLGGVSSLFGHVKDYLDARKGAKLRVKDYTPAVSQSTAKEGLETVLMQVKALAPNPEARLKAIEAAERQRQKALAAGQNDEFAEELAHFVGGKKLKMTGGTEETERLRRLKSEQTLRAMMNGTVPAQAATDEPVPPLPSSTTSAAAKEANGVPPEMKVEDVDAAEAATHEREDSGAGDAPPEA